MKKIIGFIKRNKAFISLFLLVFAISIFINAYSIIISPPSIPEKVDYWDFEEMVESGQVSLVEYSNEEAIIYFKDVEENVFYTGNPRTEDFKKWLYDNRVEVTEITVQENFLLEQIFDLLKIVIMYGFLFWILTRMMPGSKKEKISTHTPNITFDNVAGYNETKKNMAFLVEFLKNGQKIKDIGARIPKGVVLYGPPGTGKTLFAKAISGTAGVPFYNASGSDFVEMYVGLGARRVRSLYETAKKNAPCIVFIDEIDAVGGKRGAGHAEKDQTINALLAELDGFAGSEGIITICATNRIDELDPALIRPGRFDRHIAVPLPDRNDRLEILKVHSKNKKISENVRLDDIAHMTVGFSGASLEALLNEAAIIAVSESCDSINSEHIDQAFFKIVMRGEKKEHNKENNKDIEVAAFHEAGHALATKLLTNDEVPKVTIVGTTSGAGGVTFRSYDEKSFWSKRDMENAIKVAYAGRAAERIYFGNDEDITTGASSDIQQSTKMIRSYISQYGMSDSFGLLNIDELRGETGITAIGEEMLVKTATELSRKLYDEVFTVLLHNEETLRRISEELLRKESLGDADLNKLMEGGAL